MDIGFLTVISLRPLLKSIDRIYVLCVYQNQRPYIYIYIYIHVCMLMHIYICIYTMFVHIYIYVLDK